jgi:hypothetical protein
MIIKPTKDVDKIINVLKEPSILDRISEDGFDVDVWMPDIKEAFFITDENNIGLMIYHWINGVTLECHVQVLPEFRQYAMEFGKKSLEWAWLNTKATKIVAQIPTIYQDVVRFAIKSGFIIEGVNQKSHLKNGVLNDQFYLGLIKPVGV